MLKVKLAHELKAGDKVLLGNIKVNESGKSYTDYDKATVIAYIQCCGMGHIKYGEYGYLYVNSDRTAIITYKNAPFIVEE